ncbi:MAG: hypothetical protein NTW29_08655 [Bacteroidetes bacterium]|nr:hypothetical protein [Bacteroidota bacterium]
MEKFILCITALLSSFALRAQDYIITLNNDTLPCRMVQDPRKTGLRPAGNYRDGYSRIAVLFPGDSLRVFDPGQIRGYYRNTHGKGLLCDGHFESLKLQEATSELVTEAEKKTFSQAFLFREKNGEYAAMYKLLRWGRRLNTYYYVVKKEGGDTLTARLLTGRKSLRAIFCDEDIKSEMEAVIRKTKRFGDMVDAYNRLKANARKHRE